MVLAIVSPCTPVLSEVFKNVYFLVEGIWRRDVLDFFFSFFWEDGWSGRQGMVYLGLFGMVFR